MAKKKSAKLTDTPVETIRHKDKRKNIPTEELRDLYRDEPGKMLYPRDPSLDPQLVWKGKDEQDRQPLEVPLLPIYIQEKIHPRAIIEDLRERFAQPDAQQQFDFFGDFNGLTPLQKIDFYRYDAHWTNRMILGDSLAVMTSLAEKEGLKGQVQMIYLDPPYGIKFGSNWQVSTRKRDVKDGKVEDATRQPEQVKAFRDTWELGIHSYLAYLRDRLIAARELLTDSGSVFVQIGDENVHLVRAVLDEVFGSENFRALITAKKTGGLGGNELKRVADYIIWYCKRVESVKYRPFYFGKEAGMGAGTGERYDQLELADGGRRPMSTKERDNPSLAPADARPFKFDNLKSGAFRENTTVPFDFRGKTYHPGPNNCWKSTVEGLSRAGTAGRVAVTGSSLSYVRFIDDFPVYELTNIWTDTGPAADKTYVVQTTTRIVERCILMTTDPGDLVLDPTCGSGTTAYVAEQWGRRWITCDTSRVALALARTRLMAARFPYYLLADSPEGVAKEAELTGQMPPPYKTEDNIKKGFVYRRVPHVTLKSIANNEEIDAIHGRWQEELGPLRAELNKLTKQKWEEWEVPRQPHDDWPAAAKKKLAQWWDKRRERQQEIDASIAKAADQELLFDQPYEAKKRLRVTGPFTVESLSPHRRLTVQDKREGTKLVPGLNIREIGPDKFGTAMIDNLRKAGIQTRERRERLKFDNLSPFAGEWLHASGEFTDSEGKQKRVAVCIGPEHGTVGPELVKEAAKEASRGLGFDLLYVCGFAFDPHVDEEAKRYGNLNVQICRMNPDLSMGDELLKKTGAGNLFMVFGEPDIVIKRLAAAPTRRKPGVDVGAKQVEEQFVVEIFGVDVYDPTTGEIRNNSTDDIACWFIDTDYDEDSFFVRHAYFTGADQPYEKLKRALRADIDEAAWSALYSTKSQPFPMPGKKGKIAVKVINHYGDEVLKVYGPKDFAKAKAKSNNGESSSPA
ncbi:MAG: site-specific DNA-methyltransferase [Pirellulaceae bacterium]